MFLEIINYNMDEKQISRAYLETLSFSDLSVLADRFGVDVPVDLDRRFLIAELLEINEELNQSQEDMVVAQNSDDDAQEFKLPHNYNETQVSCVLANPAWLFVFWNIGDSDFHALKKLGNYTLKLRICTLESSKDALPVEAFEIQTVNESQEQFVLLPTGKKYIKVELVYTTATSGKVLAFSPVISIPQGAPILTDLQLGRDDDNFPEIIKLSGMSKILKNQYKNYRHSFS